jgi:S1-C subfamily serine protease
MRGTFRKFAAVACFALLVAVPAAAEAPCDKSFDRIYGDVAPIVTRIFAVSIDPFSLAERVQPAIGAGVLIDADGHVITNAHLVYGAGTIIVWLKADDVRPGKLVGADPISDVAVVQVPGGTGGFPKAQFGDSDHLAVGEDVLAIGHPFGLTASATRGIISGTGRVVPRSPMSWMTPLIQTDAAINPGNSGGPLVNRCGEVIGINTIAAGAGTVNFAIPINIARDLAAKIIADGRVIRPWYGIYGRVLNPELQFLLGMGFGMPFAHGLLVETVEPGSPAEKIGLRGGDFPVVMGVDEYLVGGDIIIKVSGEELKDTETVVRIVRSLKVGDTISLEYYRGGEKHTAEVTLPERPVLPGDIRRLRQFRTER